MKLRLSDCVWLSHHLQKRHEHVWLCPLLCSQSPAPCLSHGRHPVFVRRINALRCLPRSHLVESLQPIDLAVLGVGDRSAPNPGLSCP